MSFMDSNFKKIIKLITKTGDRFVVSDSGFEMPYVVMSLESYENLVLADDGLGELEETLEETSEAKLLEKINRDIAVWKSQQEKLSETLGSLQTESKKEDGEETKTPVVEQFPQKEEEKEDAEEGAEDQYYFEPLES